MSDAPSPIPRVEETNALFADVYGRLKSMASRQRVRAGGPASLCTTEIVHEVYVKMSGSTSPRFENALQFFCYAARAMRHVLIDLARRRLNIKAGGDLTRVAFSDTAIESVAIEPNDALELDEALRALEHESPRAAQVLELHFFAGLSLAQVAQLTGLSPRTVDRDWRYARSFLAVHATR